VKAMHVEAIHVKVWYAKVMMEQGLACAHLARLPRRTFIPGELISIHLTATDPRLKAATC
jgi:hypothetical protein